MDSVDQLQMLHETVKLWVILDRIEKHVNIPEVCFTVPVGCVSNVTKVISKGTILG